MVDGDLLGHTVHNALRITAAYGLSDVERYHRSGRKEDLKIRAENIHLVAAVVTATKAGSWTLLDAWRRSKQPRIIFNSNIYGIALAAAVPAVPAVHPEEEHIMKYLVEEAKAEVNHILEYGAYGSSLAAAASDGSVGIVRHFVEDANIGKQM